MGRPDRVDPLYAVTVNVPDMDATGTARVYPGTDQVMMARTTLTVGPRHNPPLTDDVVLSVAVGSAQSVLLEREAVAALAWALTARVRRWIGWADAQGSYPTVDRSATSVAARMGHADGCDLAVVGYGRPWKTRTVALTGEQRAALARRLNDWRDAGWPGVNRVTITTGGSPCASSVSPSSSSPSSPGPRSPRPASPASAGLVPAAGPVPAPAATDPVTASASPDPAATCDRCDDAEAMVRVTCWVGCEHRQCEDCAAATVRERNEV